MKGRKANVILLLVTLAGFFVTAEIVIRAIDAFNGYNFFQMKKDEFANHC